MVLMEMIFSTIILFYANTPATRAHKPTDADMGPHNWGGGEARPSGASMRGRRRGR